MSKKVKRLYQGFHPKNYQLLISPDAEALTFSGEVAISGQKIGRPSKRITFHQKDLKVREAKITHTDKKGTTKEIPVSRINHHAGYDEVRLHCDEMLFPGAYTITLKFDGKIAKNMTGLYPCSFEYEGQQKRLLATQFESHHAREVFPCIDEPEAKATFDLTLVTPTDKTVLSNMPVKSQKKAKQLTTTFEQTPIMSSYLLAFVVGDIHSVSASSKNGIEINTWGHIGQPKKFLKYANDEAIRVIDFFEDYFDTPFPLKKCDQIALPDFESGAMENWGLITYREVALLTDPDNRSVSSEQYVSMVIAHELSHQWFGNLVTMKWWDDLWLNESFASLMEHVALDKLHPDWHQWEHYASSDIIACSNRDIYKDVQPVRVDVRHPDEISTLFDPAIVYAKGGRLLKMLMDYLGEDIFRKGLREYFKVHRYKNTTRDDLWESLSKVSNVDVNAFMNPWLEQSGMPLVRVRTSEKVMSLSQERFVLDSENDESVWPVPLLADQKLEHELFDSKNTDLNLTDSPPLLNINGSGHYLVKYEDQAQRKKLAEAIQSQTISAQARINALNDMLLLTKRGDQNIVDALQIIKECREEPRDAVWAIICRTIGLSMILAEEDNELEDNLKQLKRNLAGYWYEKLGWESSENDDPNQRLLRTTALSLMVSGEDKSAIDRALKLYKNIDIQDLPAEERALILGTAVRHDGSKETIEKLMKLYKTTANPDLQSSIASALTHTKDVKVAQKLINEGLSKDGFVRNQDIFRWFAMLMRNRYSRDLAWNWLVENWDRLEEDFGGGKSLDHFVVYSAGPLHTRVWQKKFTEFFEPKRNQVALARNITVAYAEIEARVAWHNRDLPELKAYFK